MLQASCAAVYAGGGGGSVCVCARVHASLYVCGVCKHIHTVHLHLYVCVVCVHEFLHVYAVCMHAPLYMWCVCMYHMRLRAHISACVACMFTHLCMCDVYCAHIFSYVYIHASLHMCGVHASL